MTDYSTLVNNVNKFYTDGSAAIDYLNAQELTLEEMGQVIEASDRFNVVRNANGEIINFTQKVTTSTSSGGVAAGLDSNAAQVSRQTVEIPLQTSVNSAGKVTLTQGLTSAGKFLTSTVIPAVAAASVGISLGKWIDSALYNANPDFWDANGMSALDPETWDSITAGDDSISSNLFNMVFEIDPETGQAQPYIDQNALAYLVGYMLQQGVFAPSESVVIRPPSGVTVPSFINMPIKFVKLNNASDLYTYGTNGSSQLQIRNNSSVVYTAIFIYPNSSTSTRCRVVYVSENPFEASWAGWNTASARSYNGRSWYGYEGTDVKTNPMGGTSPYNRLNSYDGWSFTEIYQIESTILFGTIQEGGGIDGLSSQDGATQFDASGIGDPTDIPSILSALQSQFPQLFSDAITQPLPDIDPAPAADPVYVPIGLPQLNPVAPTQPIADIATQSDPAPLPEDMPVESMDDLANEIVEPDPDPNPPDTGNGNTPIVSPPAGSATALWSIYNPTQAQINAFGAWLWSNDFVDQLKKIFNDPMESIISLHKVFGTPLTGGTQNIAVGYLNSGVSSKVVTAQYTDVDCGSVQLSEYFGNVYDYKDTSVELYLPFIGIVPLSVSDVMRATIHVVYHIDVLTGACLADVEVTRDAGAGGVLYQYSGDCAVHYPVSSGSYIGIVGGILSAGAGIAGTIASGGAAAPLVLGGASALMRMHTDIARSGGFSANAGAMGAKVPYLIITRPQTALPENYLDIEGIGSNKTVTLNTCAGYTRIKEVYLQGVGDATEGELNELETLLKAGVIFPINETPPND